MIVFMYLYVYAKGEGLKKSMWVAKLITGSCESCALLKLLKRVVSEHGI